MGQLLTPPVRQGGPEARTLLFWAIVIVAFVGGVFTAFPLGELIQKLTVVALSVALVVVQRDRPIAKSAIWVIFPYLLYVLYSFVSSSISFGSLLTAAAAIQPLVIGALIYLWAVRVPLEKSFAMGLKIFFVVLIILQFAVVLIKLVVHGVDEKILIGTMSHVAGQLGFLFPAVAMPIVIFMMRSDRLLAVCALVFFLFAFGIINEKRSVVFLLPILLLASYLANKRMGNRKVGWFRMLVAAIFVVLLALVGMSVIPSLNVSESSGGAISVLFAFQYAVDYLTMDYGGGLQGSYDQAVGDKGVQVGRLILWASIFQWAGSVDIGTLLFGLGYGRVTPSSWLSGEDDLLFDAIGTRGAISGAGMALIETGVIGLVLMIAFFVSIFLCVLRARKRVKRDVSRRWLNSMLVILSVFVYDFFFYSIVLLRTMPMPLLFFALIASIALVQQWDLKDFAKKEPLDNGFRENPSGGGL